MDEGSKAYTAFSTPESVQFEFNVMPFGLKIAPATFQKLMTHILAGYLGQFTMAHLDDVVVYSDDLDQHLEYM